MSYTPFKMKGFPKLEGVDLTKKKGKGPRELTEEAKEDAAGVGSGSNRKVMTDGAPVDGFIPNNRVKSDAEKKVITKKKEFDAMSDAEKAALQESRNQRKRDFDKERAKKGK